MVVTCKSLPGASDDGAMRCYGGTNRIRRVHDTDAILRVQPLDNRTLNRLETAVSKSSYVGQGKKLKVTNEVGKENGRAGESTAC